MNKRQVIASLNKVANELDNSGMFQEANEITNVMKRLAQAQMFGPRIPNVGNRQPQMGNMQLAQPRQPNIQPMADPMFPQAQAPQGTPFTSPEEAVTNAQVAFQGLGNAMSQPQQTSGDTANQMQAMNKIPAPAAPPANPSDPNYLFETSVYQNALNKIIENFKNKNGNIDSVYSDAITKIKNPKRQQLFMNQIQRLRSQYFPAQSLKPGSY